jgi:hypothetical protein
VSYLSCDICGELWIGHGTSCRPSARRLPCHMPVVSDSEAITPEDVAQGFHRSRKIDRIRERLPDLTDVVLSEIERIIETAR